MTPRPSLIQEGIMLFLCFVELIEQHFKLFTCSILHRILAALILSLWYRWGIKCQGQSCCFQHLSD